MASNTEGFKEYKVKLANVDTRRFHVMRFKPPHHCDIESLTNPTLERQVAVVTTTDRAPLPEYGEGSEHGRKWKEEARRKKKGYEIRKVNPDSQPWILREQKKGGQHFLGRKEGGVNTSSSYYILSHGQDGSFEAYPVENWYDFTPPVKYNFLNEEEAEARFEKRHKTLNLFSVMLSKRLKGKQEGEEEEERPAEVPEEGKEKSKGRAKRDKLALTDSDSDFASEGGDNSDEQKDSDGGSKKVSAKKLLKGKKKTSGGDSEAENEPGEESDEGDFESKEVDYMSDSSSESEKEFKVKEALKEAPKDDEELERHETGEIDKGFSGDSGDSSEEEENELTEEGKKIKALMDKQVEDIKEADDVDDVSAGGSEEEEDHVDVPPPPKSNTPTPAADTIKMEVDEELATKADQKGLGTKGQKSLGTREGTSKKESGKPHKRAADDDVSATPVVKKPKVESTASITEEEVRRYLERKPITSKELVKKFTSKKPDMDKQKVVNTLSDIIRRMKDVEQIKIKEKLYLSLKTGDQATVT